MPALKEKLEASMRVVREHVEEFIRRKPFVKDKIEDFITVVEDLPGFFADLGGMQDLVEAAAYLQGVADGQDCTIRELLEEEGVSYFLEE